MSNRSAAVDEFLRDLDHPRNDELAALRDASLASDPEIGEHIEWKAPSFVYGGDDPATFRLRPGNRLQLILHRGARVRSDPFEFEDDGGLLEWAAHDRATLSLERGCDLPAVLELIGRWMRAVAA